MKTRFYNGKIYIGQGKFENSLFVEDGKVVSSFSNSDKVNGVDLGGATVIPGLNDSHLHLVQKGQALSRVDLSKANSIEEVILMCKEFIAENPRDFIYGRGWNQDYFVNGEKRLLDRHDLDKICSDRPIILERVCGHVGAMNTKAIEFIGITSSTNIDGGEIKIGDDGKPNGIVTENALNWVKEFIPKETEVEMKQIILNAMDYAVKWGLTSVGSTDYYPSSYKVNPKLITSILNNKEHFLRYDPQFNFLNIEDLKDYYDNFYKDDSLYNETYTRGALKLFKDGSLGGRTAHLRNPYNDDPTTNGLSALENSQVEEFLDFCEEHSIRMIVHSIGDQTVEDMINIYSKKMKKGNPNRHGIVHCQITDYEQLNRISENKIYIYYQPVFLQYDSMILEDRVGKELASTSYAFKTMQDLDSTLVSYGTDAPVEDLNPFENIYHAVTRQRLDGTPKDGFYLHERVSVDRAIDAYTIGSAYSQGLESIKGTLTNGKLADFVVLDSDIFSCADDEIKKIKPVATYIGGEKVYEKV